MIWIYPICIKSKWKEFMKLIYKTMLWNEVMNQFSNSRYLLQLLSLKYETFGGKLKPIIPADTSISKISVEFLNFNLLLSYHIYIFI